MAKRPSQPQFGNMPDPAGTEDATVLPAGKTAKPRGKAFRGRRVLQLSAIVLIALAAGQFIQSYRAGGARIAAAATSQPPESKAARTPAIVLSAVPAAISVPGAPVVAAASSCAAKLSVTAGAEAMLDLALDAPCHRGERVVLQHAGLSVTGKVDGEGHLTAALPALATDGAVAVVFADGQRVNGAAPVPELAGMRRLALQSRSGDGFSLLELQRDSGFGLGSAGADQSAGAGGWLVRLGAEDVAQPLVAEVYTYPTDTALTSTIAIVARVSPENCGARCEARPSHRRGGSRDL